AGGDGVHRGELVLPPRLRAPRLRGQVRARGVARRPRGRGLGPGAVQRRSRLLPGTQPGAADRLAPPGAAARARPAGGPGAVPGARPGARHRRPSRSDLQEAAMTEAAPGALGAVPRLRTLAEVVELVEAVSPIYVRFSAGPDVDSTSVSRDHESGCLLPGLSTNPLDPEP